MPLPLNETEEQGSSQLNEKLKTGRVLWAAAACAFIAIAYLVFPAYVIRPFRPQDPGQLNLALTVRGAAPWISALCALAVLWIDIAVWQPRIRLLPRCILVFLSVITVAAACLTHVNDYEIMFHPYPAPVFVPANTAQTDADEKVLSVTLGTETHAYPIRTIGYHHVVNDTVGGIPIAATYCTLCHAGLVWKRVMDGRALHFQLAGINNGNALIRDLETGTIWQQSTGQAIFGHFKGRQLELVHSDELTFSLWRTERPNGLVLLPDAKYVPEYDSKDWEADVEKTHVVVDTHQSGIPPHELMLGMIASGQSRAWPVKSILAVKLIEDRFAGNPILILVGPDHASIRVFQARIADQPLTFVRSETTGQSADSGIMQDIETSSIWNFQGCATAGKLAGKCLGPMDANKDYWFDWMNRHPTTSVFKN
jgi:hypothetical protein